MSLPRGELSGDVAGNASQPPRQAWRKRELPAGRWGTPPPGPDRGEGARPPSHAGRHRLGLTCTSAGLFRSPTLRVSLRTDRESHSRPPLTRSRSRITPPTLSARSPPTRGSSKPRLEAVPQRLFAQGPGTKWRRARGTNHRDARLPRRERRPLRDVRPSLRGVPASPSGGEGPSRRTVDSLHGAGSSEPSHVAGDRRRGGGGRRKGREAGGGRWRRE